MQPQQPDDGRTRIPVSVNVALKTGPDGQPWIKLDLTVGIATVGVLLPDATADELGPLIAGGLTEGAAAARREKVGLILPNSAPDLRINGSGPHSGR
jgi:hypothetical protein